MISRRVTSMLAAAVVLSTLVSCAKRPAVTRSSAPSPSGSASWVGSGPSQPGSPAPGSPAPRTTAQLPAGSSPSDQQAAARPADARQAESRPLGAGAGGAPPARAPLEGFVETSDLRPVHFDFDKYDIRPDAAKTLRDNAARMKARAEEVVLVEGHADERGTFEYNLALGDRRAAAVKSFLVRQGVRAARITLISYGEAQPACTAQAEDCWSRNRRAQFRVKPR